MIIYFPFKNVVKILKKKNRWIFTVCCVFVPIPFMYPIPSHWNFIRLYFAQRLIGSYFIWKANTMQRFYAFFFSLLELRCCFEWSQLYFSLRYFFFHLVFFSNAIKLIKYLGFYHVEIRDKFSLSDHFLTYFCLTVCLFFRCMVLHSLQHKIAFVCSRTEWSTNTRLYKTMFNRTIESVESGLCHLRTQKKWKGNTNSTFYFICVDFNFKNVLQFSSLTILHGKNDMTID